MLNKQFFILFTTASICLLGVVKFWEPVTQVTEEAASTVNGTLFGADGPKMFT